MNNRDRAFLLRVERVITTVGSLNPPNPANIAAIATNLPLATKASKEVARALSAWRCGDGEWAEDYLRDAEEIATQVEALP